MTTSQDSTPLRPSQADSEAQAGIPNPYHEEAKARWGSTDAWKQSQERVGKMSKEQFAEIGREADDITRGIVALKDAGKNSSDPQVIALVEKHYHWLRHFYEPSHEMYRGLGDMYVQDERFTAHYEKYGPGTAQFMRDAMHAFCDSQEILSGGQGRWCNHPESPSRAFPKGINPLS